MLKLCFKSKFFFYQKSTLVFLEGLLSTHSSCIQIISNLLTLICKNKGETVLLWAGAWRELIVCLRLSAIDFSPANLQVQTQKLHTLTANLSRSVKLVQQNGLFLLIPPPITIQLTVQRTSNTLIIFPFLFVYKWKWLTSPELLCSKAVFLAEAQKLKKDLLSFIFTLRKINDYFNWRFKLAQCCSIIMFLIKIFSIFLTLYATAKNFLFLLLLQSVKKFLK